MIHSVLKHRCVMLRDTTVLLWLWLKLRQQTWAKTVNIVLQIVNFVSASLTMKNSHTDDMFSVPSKRAGGSRVSSWDELMRGVRLEAAATDRRITSKYRESDSKASALDRLRVLLQVQPRKWQLEKDLLCPNTLLVSLKSKRLHPPPPPPQRKHTSSILDDSHK